MLPNSNPPPAIKSPIFFNFISKRFIYCLGFLNGYMTQAYFHAEEGSRSIYSAFSVDRVQTFPDDVSGGGLDITVAKIGDHKLKNDPEFQENIRYLIADLEKSGEPIYLDQSVRQALIPNCEERGSESVESSSLDTDLVDGATPIGYEISGEGFVLKVLSYSRKIPKPRRRPRLYGSKSHADKGVEFRLEGEVDALPEERADRIFEVVRKHCVWLNPYV